MHILQIAPYFPPYLGGQEKYVYYLSRELVRQGHEVTVLTSNVPKSPSYEIMDGIHIFRYHCLAKPLRNPITPGLFFPPSFSSNISLVHTHNEHSFTSVVASIEKYVFKRPVIITCHGKLVFGSKFPDAIRMAYSKTLGKAVMSSMERVTVATPSERQRIIREYNLKPEGIDVVPVGIDIEHWDSLKHTSLSSTKINFPGKKLILVATQLIKRKGIDYLIRAMSKVILSIPEVVLAIAGTGDDEPGLRQLVKNQGLSSHVFFLGRLTDQELAVAYRNASIFVLPSLGEGQPTCIMEAWTYSCPVIATRIEGVEDYFSDAALLVPPANSEALADGLIRALNNPQFAQEIGRKGRQLIETKFAWPKIAGQMIQVYQKTISGD